SQPGDCDWIARPKELSVHDINALYRMYERPLGQNHPGDEYGTAFAAGDFDGDGYDDLAFAAPGKTAVFLWRGVGGYTAPGVSAPGQWRGLRPSAAVALLPSPPARSGAALAAGDSDGAAKIDLRVGAPAEDGGTVDDGTVFIYLSGKPNELSPRRS